LSATDHEAAARDVVRRLRDRNWLRSASDAARSLAIGRFNRDLLAGDLARVLAQAIAA
jgi:hypothetical protein